jgi:probable F420-dependent oxidoreductase
LGIGSGARPEIITAVARSAESHGFATLWAGEHVVMVERPDRPYPYSADGRIAVPAEADWLDPWITLTYAAAVTSEIMLATGILLLPEHQPLVVAKQAASLDLVSGGRLRLGVGIGWSAEEFAALGVPFEARAARTEEYVDVLRTLWREDVATYEGRFVRFGAIRSHPKPLRRCVPIFFGGNTDSALDRVARLGDGWYGFNLDLDEVEERLGFLSQCCQRHGRDRAEITVAVAPKDPIDVHHDRLRGLAVDELVVVASPPGRPEEVGSWVDELARMLMPGP